MTYYAGFTYNYHYTGRNQLKDINYQNYAPMIAYQYDQAGNRTVRSMYNGTTTDYAPVDALNRSSWVRHTFAGGQTARFDYAFDEMSRLKYEQRNSGAADGYSYDQAGEVTGQIRDGTLSNGTVTGTNLPLSYDGAGNRTNTWGIPYTTNNLNEYTSVGGAPVSSDPNGNIQTRNGWTYTYDAQNRLRRATDGTKYLDFYYDGLNRQITRGVNNGSGVWKVTFSVWDGWRLLEERGLGDVLQRIYFYGAKTDELVCAFGGAYNTGWFTQDGRGNVSHVFNDSANLVERYTYGLAGDPLIWDANNSPLSESTIENRFMFQGRDYLKEGAIYDYRNRFYLPSLGRFIQTDPLGFGGGDANLFRYCGNDPVNKKDPNGTDVIVATYDIPGAPVDHIGIGVFDGNPQTSQTFGFNPEHFSLGLFVGRDYRSTVEVDPMDRRTDYVVLQTSPEQDATLLDFIDFVRNNPDVFSYNLYGSNCGSFFVESALARIGIYVRRDTIPNRLMNNVRQSPHAQSNNNGTGGSGGGGETGSPNTASSGTPGLTTQITVGVYLNTTYGSPAFNAFVAAFPNALVVSGWTSNPGGGMSLATFRDGQKIRMKH